MWQGGLGTGAGSTVPDNDALNKTVQQLGGSVLVLGHEVVAEPCKALATVVQHVRVSLPLLVETNHQLQARLHDLEGMREELEDGAAALEGMTSAGLDGLHRMFANLQAVELAKDVFC